MAWQPGIPGLARLRLGVLLAAAAFALGGCSTDSDGIGLGGLFGRKSEAPAPARAEAPPPAPVPKAARAVSDSVLGAQTLLAEMGYRPGPIDGVYGPRTRAAVLRYQADAGLPADGKVSPELVQSLRRAAASRRGPEPGKAGEPFAPRIPAYVAGDAFVYSNGLVETVVSVEDETVAWRDEDGMTRTAHWNFVLPPIASDSNGRRQTTTLNAAPEALWPRRIGERISFTAATEFVPAMTPLSRAWTCEATGEETIAVAAGTFDTLRLACAIEIRSAIAPGSARVERVWYYAPRIRHFVRRDERMGTSGPYGTVELVAMQPGDRGWPPAARTGLAWAFRGALEEKRTGEAVEWSSSGVEAQVTITPTAEDVEDARLCRTFEQSVRSAGGSRLYVGRLCRTQAGAWVAPGAELPVLAARGN